MEHDTTTTNASVTTHEDKEVKIKTKRVSKKTAGEIISLPASSPSHDGPVSPKQHEGGRYISAIGRRKTSVARVRITESSKNSFTVNQKDLATYFPTKELQMIVEEAVLKSKVPTKFHIEGRLYGGGIHSQAEAFRHGISRALVTYDLELRKRLKKLGFLKRDPRMKERRKFGLKKARKAPQWSKR